MTQPTRTVFVVGLLCLLAPGLSAQITDTLGLPTDHPKVKTFLVTAGGDTLVLSDTPTVTELTKLFAATGQGKLDPFQALPTVIGKGDSSVPALDTLLFSDPIAEIVHRSVSPGMTGPGAGIGVALLDDTVRPNKLYAAMALEAIASEASYRTLMLAAQTHPNIDVRGVALRALASAYHEADRLSKFIPDKELLHLLVISVDDTAMVPYLEKSVGQIAREGLITWMGEDFGEPQGKMRGLKDAAGADAGTLAEYRDRWWQLNVSKIAWDKDSNSFRIR